jgi:uncharacterized membrane protein YfcA
VFVGIGFFFGAFLGAKVATPNIVLKKVFGVALLLIAVYWLLCKYPNRFSLSYLRAATLPGQSPATDLSPRTKKWLITIVNR